MTPNDGRKFQKRFYQKRLILTTKLVGLQVLFLYTVKIRTKEKQNEKRRRKSGSHL